MENITIYRNIAGCSLILSVVCTSSALAQVIPDRTLPDVSIVSPNCTDCIVTGGTQAGRNLFHSFEQFSIPTGGRAFFDNAATIQNIFTRITGRSPSNIDGILQTNGTANLFLLNPNGIIFGRNASLNLGGSFFATTADRIDFTDNTQFSAVNPEASSLLTISTPVGLQFGQSAGSIINRSRSRISGLNTLNAPVGLQVPVNQTLALVANGVFLENGNLTARSGQIELGSIAPNERVGVVSNGDSYDLTFDQTQRFANIRVSSRSAIDTSGENTGFQRDGGAIQIQGQNIFLTAQSSIFSNTFQGIGENLLLVATETVQFRSAAAIATSSEGNGQAGDIIIQADNAVRLRNTGSFVGSLAPRGSAGNAGDILIDTQSLSLHGGAQIEASTFGLGSGGAIQIQASTVEVIGSNQQEFVGGGRTIPVGELSSAIFSQVGTAAGAEGTTSGDLTIATDRLILRAGGVISTATFGQGSSGTLNINATESIAITGTTPAVTRNQYRSGIFTSAEPGATGNVGRLRITTDRLTVTDRGEISANNRGTGAPGTARLNVNQLTLQSGGEIRASSPRLPQGRIPNQGNGGRLIVNANDIQVTGTGTIESETFPSAIAAFSESAGDAGDLAITALSLNVLDGGEISVSGRSTGAAGNLSITADRITLDRGSITASTQSGSGAEINLDQVNFLTLQNNSLLSARAANQAQGGNITVTAPDGFVIATGNNNDIIADAFKGRGGNITIAAQSILGLTEQQSTPFNSTNDIDASSQFGAPGSVTLNQINPDPGRGAVELPTDIIDASRLIAQNCSEIGAIARTPSEFVITGRSGLPPSPTEPVNPSSPLGQWISAPDSATNSTQQDRVRSIPITSEIVEAQGWVKTAEGAIVLTVEAAIPPQASTTSLSCSPAQSEQPLAKYR
jgi:filamentous hemagglutinin family protein